MSLRCVARSRRLRLSLIALTHGYPLTPIPTSIVKQRSETIGIDRSGVSRNPLRERLQRSRGAPRACLESTSFKLAQVALS